MAKLFMYSGALALGSLLVGSDSMAAAAPAPTQERGSRPPAGREGPPQGERPERPKRGVAASAEGADMGLTLFTPLRSKNTYLVDAMGETVHTWPSEFTPGNSAYLLPDGSVLRCAKDGGDSPFSGGGEGGRIQRVSWGGELLWDYAMADDDWRHHHDIQPMPNGHVLAIVWEGVGQKDAMRRGRDRDQVAEVGLWPDAVIELAPKGLNGAEVVWEWHAWDHLVQDRNEEFPNYGAPKDHPGRIDVNFDVLTRPKTAEELGKEAEVEERLRGLGYTGGDDDEPEEEGRGRGPRSDWMHTNAIDYHPALDLVAISVRSASEVWIIDHSTTSEQAKTSEGGRYGHGGDLLYRFGHSGRYGGTGEQQLFNQHDARFVDVDGALHMTVFNNGSGRPGGDRSSVDEYSLPFSAESGFEVAENGHPSPANLVWTWDGGETEHYNGHISGAQRLANGSTLMCLGEDGRTLEISPEGEILWDWLQPVGNDEPGREAEERGGRGGPPGGDRPGGDRPGGDRPGGDRPGGDGPRGDRPGPPGGGRRGGNRARGGGGGGPRSEFAIFRVTRYDASYPGLEKLKGAGGK